MKRVIHTLLALAAVVISYGQTSRTMAFPAETEKTREMLTTSNDLITEQSGRFIGEYYGGGIVFYLDEEGKHGLITTTIDKSTRKQQKSDAYIHTNAVRDGITTGRFNSDRLQAMKGEGAAEGENIEDTSLSDWYLPTRYDLLKLYRNRAVIGGYTEFARGWKSTQFSSVNEWYRSFITGGEFRNGKDDAVYIRVIRKF